MILGAKTKYPTDARTYAINWSKWLTGLNNDTISSSVWTVPQGLTLVAQSNTTTKTTVRIGSGTVGVQYTVYNTVTTAAGEIRTLGFILTPVTP